jgi:hypothetical protein
VRPSAQFSNVHESLLGGGGRVGDPGRAKYFERHPWSLLLCPLPSAMCFILCFSLPATVARVLLLARRDSRRGGETVFAVRSQARSWGSSAEPAGILVVSAAYREDA